MIARLWNRWIERTRREALRQVSLDSAFFGNGFMERRWWGWRRIDPFTVFMRPDYSGIDYKSNAQQAIDGEDK